MIEDGANKISWSFKSSYTRPVVQKYCFSFLLWAALLNVQHCSCQRIIIDKELSAMSHKKSELTDEAVVYVLPELISWSSIFMTRKFGLLRATLFTVDIVRSSGLAIRQFTNYVM